MKFNKIYETTSSADFAEVCRIFELNHIPFEVLHEYRLFSEKRYDSAADQGGAIIRVSPNHYVKANHLLLNAGLKSQVDIVKDRFKIVRHFGTFSSRIPLLKRLSLPYQLLVSLVIVGVIVLGIILFSSYRDWKSVDIIDQTLLVRSLEYNGMEVPTKTIRFFTIKGANDFESLSFKKYEHRVRLPGIESSPITAFWQKNGDIITISGADNFCDIFNGIYQLEKDFWRKTLRLRSATTTIELRLLR